jgi:membrane protein implicated in regulation of membrane protease activity
MIFICFSFILFIIEVLTPGTFFFFSFAIGALISSLLAFRINDFSTLLIITALVALVSYVILGHFDIFNLKKIKSNSNMDSYIGKTALVLSIINNNTYRVKIYGEEWTAHCDTTLKVGDKVEVFGRDSLLLFVKIIT